MRIISVRQPWAHAIIHGGKDVENRTANLAGAYRGPVAIHASRQRDDEGWVRFGGYALTNTMNRGLPDALGAIIGVVDLVDAHRHHPQGGGCTDSNNQAVMRARLCSEWAEPGVHHLVLSDPRPLAEPIPFTGALGLRALDADTIARIEAQL